MYIAYFNVNLKVGRDGITSVIFDELVEQEIQRFEFLQKGFDVGLFNTQRRSNSWSQRFSNKGKAIVLFVSRLVWEKIYEAVIKESKQRTVHSNSSIRII